MKTNLIAAGSDALHFIATRRICMRLPALLLLLHLNNQSRVSRGPRCNIFKFVPRISDDTAGSGRLNNTRFSFGAGPNQVLSQLVPRGHQCPSAFRNRPTGRADERARP